MAAVERGTGSYSLRRRPQPGPGPAVAAGGKPEGLHHAPAAPPPAIGEGGCHPRARCRCHLVPVRRRRALQTVTTGRRRAARAASRLRPTRRPLQRDACRPGFKAQGTLAGLGHRLEGLWAWGAGRRPAHPLPHHPQGQRRPGGETVAAREGWVSGWWRRGWMLMMGPAAAMLFLGESSPRRPLVPPSAVASSARRPRVLFG